MDIGIRPYTDVDKVAVLSLIKLNTPLYFAESEAVDFSHYLDNEKELAKWSVAVVSILKTITNWQRLVGIWFILYIMGKM